MLLLISILLIGGMGVTAQEGAAAAATMDAAIAENVLLETTQKVQLKEEPSETAATVAEFEAGTPLLSKQAAQNGWIQVAYQETTGYLPVQNVKLYGAENTIEQEFEEIRMDNDLIMSELLYRESQKRQKILWGSAIAVLVIAIFAVGIISAVKKNKEEKEQAGK